MSLHNSCLVRVISLLYRNRDRYLNTFCMEICGSSMFSILFQTQIPWYLAFLCIVFSYNNYWFSFTRTFFLSIKNCIHCIIYLNFPIRLYQNTWTRTCCSTIIIFHGIGIQIIVELNSAKQIASEDCLYVEVNYDTFEY